VRENIRRTASGAPELLGVPPDTQRNGSGYALFSSGGDPAAIPHLLLMKISDTAYSQRRWTASH